MGIKVHKAHQGLLVNVVRLDRLEILVPQDSQVALELLVSREFRGRLEILEILGLLD